MNKTVVAAIVGVAVLIGGVFAVLALTKDNTKDDTSTTSSVSHGDHSKHAAIKACNVFTLEEAQALMGAGAEAGSNTAPASSDDVKVDTCSYTFSNGDVKSIKVATVMTRSPLSDVGEKSNQDAFKEGGAAAGEAVSGYGEKAYWNASLHELNILKDGVWYSIVYGGTNPQNNTLEDAKLVAAKVVNQ